MTDRRTDLKRRIIRFTVVNENKVVHICFQSVWLILLFWFIRIFRQARNEFSGPLLSYYAQSITVPCAMGRWKSLLLSRSERNESVRIPEMILLL